MGDTLFETEEKTRHTPEGEVSYETITCKSCGQEQSEEAAKEFVVGNLKSSSTPYSITKFRFHESEYDTGYLCDYCASMSASGELAAPFTHDSTDERTSRVMSAFEKQLSALSETIYILLFSELKPIEHPGETAFLFVFRIICIITVVLIAISLIP
jgi:hypothetical protein